MGCNGGNSRKHQPAASLLWGHEKAVYMNEPGQAFRKWTQALGLTYRIKAALRVRRLSRSHMGVGVISSVLQARDVVWNVPEPY